jgi:hypothetical protein
LSFFHKSLPIAERIPPDTPPTIALTTCHSPKFIAHDALIWVGVSFAKIRHIQEAIDSRMVDRRISRHAQGGFKHVALLPFLFLRATNTSHWRMPLCSSWQFSNEINRAPSFVTETAFSGYS